VGLLEWLLIVELVVLLLAGLLWVVGYIVSRSDPNDQMWAIVRAFWRTVLRPPREQPAAAGPADEADQSDDEPPQRPAGRGRPAREGGRAGGTAGGEADSGGAPGAAGPIRTAHLTVNVKFGSDLDRVVGREGDGLMVQVTAAAEDTAGNRTVIQLVSSALNVNAYQVTLTRGHFQARKGIAITGMSQDDLAERLSSLFG
jgi:uncharacterized protein YggU (UPF0235/DUF167 family)